MAKMLKKLKWKKTLDAFPYNSFLCERKDFEFYISQNETEWVLDIFDATIKDTDDAHILSELGNSAKALKDFAELWYEAELEIKEEALQQQ